MLTRKQKLQLAESEYRFRQNQASINDQIDADASYKRGQLAVIGVCLVVLAGLFLLLWLVKKGVV